MAREAGHKPNGRKRLDVDRPPTFTGWLSTDEEEIGRREWRGKTEIDGVEKLDGGESCFADYVVTSSSGSTYIVEIRSLRERVNSCECHDYRTNQLGTCKHIEGVLHSLRGRGPEGKISGRIEVFLDERDGRNLRLTVPADIARNDPELEIEVDGLVRELDRGSGKALSRLRNLGGARPEALRVSRRLEAWIESLKAEKRRRRDNDRFMQDIGSGRRSADFLKLPLLPYQIEGAAHLAFGERALLADDMGLGKTVQAVAACIILRDLRRIGRVLVVSPASLKAEWEEQIGQFCDESVTAVFGNRMARLAAYAEGSFFTLCNYEQVLADGRDMLDTVAPDVIILDEAQRIKNWQTKTANAVKKLTSRYAFVLTGTPLENRIDEIYSIVQFLDPEILGPLFRFNREYYELDEKGRPAGFRNLDRLADRISSVMLRRRKDEVETQLPDRTTKTFFVPMTDFQRSIYDDYDFLARRLAAVAERRPLTPEEFERLQRYLACMRMVCDTPYILDDAHDDCPKMDELEKLVPELLEDPDRKIIIFSEWVRMLDLVREFAIANGLEFAWHTGSVPQHRRRAEINRFRKDPSCRLFLSSESGGVGLNLQVADTVVNLDQPWNPARLEQRISRAWRKHQTRSVNVINLVSEETIEHRMLGLLASKQALADGVLDRRGDLAEIKLPTGRNAFIERLNQVLDESGKGPPEADRLEALREDLVACHGAALRRLLVREGRDGDPDTVLVVLDLPPGKIAAEEQRLAGDSEIKLSVIDAATHESMLRLAETGLISIPAENMREIHHAGSDGQAGFDKRRILRAQALAEQAERKLKAAQLLAGGGFEDEARAPAAEAVRLGACGLAALSNAPEPEEAEAAAAFLAESESVAGSHSLDAARLLSGGAEEDDAVAVARVFVDDVSRWISGAGSAASSRGP